MVSAIAKNLKSGLNATTMNNNAYKVHQMTESAESYSR